MIEIAILYVLNKYDATIYRVMKLIDELFFAFLKTSAGSVNPAIKRLEKAGCVVSLDKMSDGGMFSKTYSITREGKKHLAELLISFNSKNPYHIANEAKIAIFCANILSVNEYIEFKENLLNNLELHKIKLERGLKNEYIELNEKQKALIQATLADINGLIELL